MSLNIQTYSMVIIETRTDLYIVRCGRCKGKGENNREYTCRVCDGKGSVFISSGYNNSDLYKCGRCKGSGENNREHFCRVCNGVGALMLDSPRQVCPKCSGKGENSSQYFCKNCNATGSIWVGDLKTY